MGRKVAQRSLQPVEAIRAAKKAARQFDKGNRAFRQISDNRPDGTVLLQGEDPGPAWRSWAETLSVLGERMSQAIDTMHLPEEVE